MKTKPTAPKSWKECSVCKGYGYVKHPDKGYVNCKKCKGEGEIYE